MQVRIDSVVIKRRVRRDLGDLTSLMESLRNHGQLTPILINRNSELIAGHRFAEAARVLDARPPRVLVEGLDHWRLREQRSIEVRGTESHGA